MHAEVFVIVHSGIDPDDIRGHPAFHEQEIADPNQGSMKTGLKYYRRRDQAEAYLLPLMFDGTGKVREDAHHKPLVGTLVKIHVDFNDDDFEPAPLTSKPVHKRGFVHVDASQVKNEPLEIRQYVGKVSDNPNKAENVPFKFELKETLRLTDAAKIAEFLKKNEEIAKFLAKK